MISEYKLLIMVDMKTFESNLIPKFLKEKLILSKINKHPEVRITNVQGKESV